MKKIQIYLIMFVMFFANAIFASDVFIEQIGNSSKINIIQQGTSNKIGSSLKSSFLGGNSSEFDIDQVGAENELNMLINGDNTKVLIDTAGSGNIQDIICGSNISVNTCDNALIDYKISGNNNKVTTNLGSTDKSATSKMNISGNGNNITHTGTHTSIAGSSISADLTVTGNLNKIDMTQSGNLNETIKINSTGNNNTISVSQSSVIAIPVPAP